MWVVIVPVKTGGVSQVDILVGIDHVGAEPYLLLLRFLRALTRSTLMRYGEARLVINPVSLVYIAPRSSTE